MSQSPELPTTETFAWPESLDPTAITDLGAVALNTLGDNGATTADANSAWYRPPHPVSEAVILIS